MRHSYLGIVMLLAAILLTGCTKEQEKAVVDESKPVPAAGEHQGAVPAVDQKLTQDLQAMIAKVVQAIKDGKLDEAGKLLTELESKKSTASESMQKQIADARKSYDAAKAAEAIKSQLPAVPKTQ